MIKQLKTQIDKLQVSLADAEVMANNEHKETKEEVENPNLLGEKDTDEEET